MNPERHRRASAIFLEACGLDPPGRARFLDLACGGDGELRREVEDLLAADADPPALLDAGALALGLPELSPTAKPRGPTPGGALPERIGGYRIVRWIGEGGMGAVYEAEQENPLRTVALKVMAPGCASAWHLRRFEHEAYLLGQLQHPGIAQIYEAGAAAAPDGEKPFFAMELVRGAPITRYADERGLGIRDRLELLARVCDAIHHAHQKGIIHRDLKPENILVTEDGQPKILDFGIARATNADVQMTTVQTGAGRLLGTVPYMSPEQVAGDAAAIDARSDVYSLGVILYRMLAGRLPVDTGERTLFEAMRAIREEEPARLGSLGKPFRGDIEAIAQKALEKDRERRYQSAAELAADIRRYLRSEPITARPVTALYQLDKFARRNKALVGGVAAAFTFLLLGTIVSLWYAGAAIEERRIAERRLGEALFQAYRASLAAASAAIEARDPAAVVDQLEAVEPGMRGWEWRYWRARNDRSVAVLDAGERIAAACFTENGSRVLMACGSGRLRRWDPETGEETGSLELDGGSFHTAALSRGGARIGAVFGPGSRAIGLWDAESGRRLGAIEDLEHPCASLAISADGRWVAGAAIERAAWIWDSASGRTLRIARAQLASAGIPRLIAFDPANPQVVIGGRFGWLGLFDLESGMRASVRDLPTNEIRCLTFNQDASLVALGDSSNKLYLGHVASGLPVAEFNGHRAPVLDTRFSPDGSLIASSGGWTVRLWRPLSNLPMGVFTGHTGEVESVAFSPDASRLLSTSRDGTARIWTMSRAESILALNVLGDHPRGAVLSPVGGMIASGSWKGRLQFWDSASGDLVADFDLARIEGRMCRVSCLAASPRGSRSGAHLASGHEDGCLRLWNVETGRMVAAAGGGGKSGRTLTIAFSPDGSLIASSGPEGALELLEVPSLTRIASRDVGPGPASGLAWAPDGRRLFRGQGRLVRVHDAGTLDPIAVLEGHGEQVICVACSPDGKLLASGSSDRTVRTWEASSGRPLAVLGGHIGPVTALAFTPDGSRLASGSEDTSIRIWDPVAGEQLTQLRGHTGRIFSLEFPAGESMLLSASIDGTVRVWDSAPLWTRWRARRLRKRRIEALAPGVERLLAETGDHAAVAARLSADPALDEEDRRIALQLNLQRSLKEPGPKEK